VDNVAGWITHSRQSLDKLGSRGWHRQSSATKDLARRAAAELSPGAAWIAGSTPDDDNHGGRTLRITFVLPKLAPRPVGGYRVVFEYANQLAQRGHEVKLVFTVFGPRGHGRRTSKPRYLAGRAREFLATQGGIPWFDTEGRVEVIRVAQASPDNLPRADFTVATAWQTADVVAAAPASRRGVPLYLIQHYETWSAGDEHDRVRATWRLPMHKIVISRWLLQIAREVGEESRTHYIPNGLDLKSYTTMRSIYEREPASVGMLVHEEPWKGTEIGLAALENVHASEPRMRASLFGTEAPSVRIPGWAVFHRNLQGTAVRDFYNRIAIFVHPSLEEGWPLPPAEAMACGAALVVADNPGVLDYAEADLNCLVVPRESSDDLAGAILRLIRDDALRERLAEQARLSIGDYTWERATDSFERLLVALRPSARGVP
jgi:glycosyltransferase involved in cell wall biosynthesis